ncbi:hypothetical protein L6164_010717 [Bauhinia variegata]|uniref:Uncharacterized protein n=1 Tax=Bauhinia variegata TaxID=167791 RepID=A0ACB9P3J8_BAUVA|nr:hypothetical protein L6164_010717 [Bauhinia variegata]
MAVEKPVPPENESYNKLKTEYSCSVKKKLKNFPDQVLLLKRKLIEPHYRKRAAERAAALIQQANDTANITFDSETHDGTCNNSSIEIKSKSDSVNKQPGGDAVNYIVFDCADRNKYKSDIEQSEVEISRVETPSWEDCNPLRRENVELGNAGQEIQALSVRRREVNSPLNLQSKTGAATLSYSPAERKAAVQAKDKINNALRSKKSVGESVEKKRLTARSLHMSINLPSCAGLRSKTTSVSELNRIKKSILIYPKFSKVHSKKLHQNPFLRVEGGRESSAAEKMQGSYIPKLVWWINILNRTLMRENSQKKLRQNSGSKSKLNEDINNVLRSPSKRMRKIPVTIPRSSSIQIIKLHRQVLEGKHVLRQSRIKVVRILGSLQIQGVQSLH